MHEAPSLERYMEEGQITALGGLESAFVGSVAALQVAHGPVREIPPLLLRRVERCFDYLDETCTGEVSLPALGAAFESPPSRELKLQSLLKAAQPSSSSASPRDNDGSIHVGFAAFLQGLFPQLGEADIQRLVLHELSLETLFRLRGVPAGVVCKQEGWVFVPSARMPRRRVAAHCLTRV
ncbi:phosphatidylinositol-4-phosphate 5-kinase [Trypanosoma conorhini]|uniref:Phosphatidylinositol-4-phosphate 5-kinase n=1 Tax=Trypanosoma conorhini TaxID=83891 RepID=A0A3R7PI82_9TRYP|nr:phosphatidylinositol-4-phosphate 5-kinase [Trypanosoma conorhini]RNF25659.1 phosphatidylinositol-4-phosphate 5-kinase [Trypanosoma conorhini]